VRLIVAALTSCLMAAIGLVLFSRLRPFRVDLAPDQNAYEGSSRFPPVNYLSRRNYSSDGHALLVLFWGWHLLMPFALAAIMWLVSSTW
jgi:hypothetical protein